MTAQFTYLNKKYTVDINPIDWYNHSLKNIIKLPNGDLLTIKNWTKVDTKSPIPQLMSADCEFLILKATEVDQEELAFQSLLKEYNLTDNDKTRTLWHKCYELGHSNGLYDIIRYWDNLVDLIIEN